MKRFSMIAVTLMVVCSSHGWAQNTLYNSSSSKPSPPIYNPSFSSSGGTPLPLKQRLRTGRAGASASGGYYGGKNARPYSLDNNDYSLQLSSSQIRRDREERNRLAQQRELENIASLGRSGEAPQTAEDILNSGQDGSTVRRRVKSKYNQRNDKFDVPKKVFNSIY